MGALDTQRRRCIQVGAGGCDAVSASRAGLAAWRARNANQGPQVGYGGVERAIRPGLAGKTPKVDSGLPVRLAGLPSKPRCNPRAAAVQDDRGSTPPESDDGRHEPLANMRKQSELVGQFRDRPFKVRMDGPCDVAQLADRRSRGEGLQLGFCLFREFEECRRRWNGPRQ